MRLTTFIAATALTALTTAAWAETYSVNSTGHGVANSTATPVGETMVVVSADTMYEGFESENSDNPLASVKGPCFGALLIDKGQISGEGLCNYTDADADVVIMRWVAGGMTADGRTTGDWSVMGGTGKWDGASGGGTFDAGSDAAGTYTNMVAGEVTLP